MIEYSFNQMNNPTAYYTKDSGYGFFTEKSRDSSKECTYPELNTGFVPSSDFKGETIIKQEVHGCYVDMGRIPLSFKADIGNQGSFLLTLSLYAKEEEEEVLLFAGRRQLVWKGSLKAGEEWKGSFPLYQTDFIPRGETVPFKDQAVEVSVISNSICIQKLQIEKWSRKTIFLAGDSTVTDQKADYPYAPESSYSGWGQMLPAYLGKSLVVSNHAHSGLTTESFRMEGHYQNMMNYVKPGDLCLFQFGHNDQKVKHLNAEGGYRDNIIRYIKETREIEVIPVLVTPLARNTWNTSDNTYNDLLADYADAIRKIGKEKNVPVLDLHEKSVAFIKEHGQNDSKKWFYPSDYTHTNDYGAWKMAGFLWEELTKAGLAESDGERKPDWEPKTKE